MPTLGLQECYESFLAHVSIFMTKCPKQGPQHPEHYHLSSVAFFLVLLEMNGWKWTQAAFNHVFPGFLSNLEKKVINRIRLQIHAVTWIACMQGQEGQGVVGGGGVQDSSSGNPNKSGLLLARSLRWTRKPEESEIACAVLTLSCGEAPTPLHLPTRPWALPCSSWSQRLWPLAHRGLGAWSRWEGARSWDPQVRRHGGRRTKLARFAFLYSALQSPESLDLQTLTCTKVCAAWTVQVLFSFPSLLGFYCKIVKSASLPGLTSHSLPSWTHLETGHYYCCCWVSEDSNGTSPLPSLPLSAPLLTASTSLATVENPQLTLMSQKRVAGLIGLFLSAPTSRLLSAAAGRSILLMLLSISKTSVVCW